MTVGGGGAGKIPAGFAYLGQFVDHDLTFDQSTVMLGENLSPSALLEARSPALDLGSLYGAGPDEPGSARFYEDDGLHLKVGKTDAGGGIPELHGRDLPRGEGSSEAHKRTAVIPDPRNDDNLAVAQTHLAFIHFHNRVIDTLPRSVPSAQRFSVARGIVVKHYQWMLYTDFLSRICSPVVVEDVFRNGRKAFEVSASPMSVSTLPIEFSVAAFRFGHSMIQDAYSWNEAFPQGQATLDLLFALSGESGDFFGGTRLPSNWIPDWRRLYDFGETGRTDLVLPSDQLNRAARIDTKLTPVLRNLPGFPPALANLAFRNLLRAKMVQLATGQEMVTFMRTRGLDVATLTPTQITVGNDGADLSDLTRQQRAALLAHTPLWFYVLREAELGGGRLDGVGARIVAETLHRAIEGSRHSIVRDSDWRPTLGPNNTSFRMVDLLLFAFNGQTDALKSLRT
jgi:hypothetical protein